MSLWTDLTNALNTVLPSQWIGSIDGVAMPAVSSFTHGLNASTETVWVEFDFTGTDNKPHKVHATYALSGTETITYDGFTKAKPKIVISNRLVVLQPRLVLEFEFAYANGVMHTYRFDGNIPL